MKRLGALIVAALVIVPVALAAAGDQTVKGSLTVNGNAFVQQVLVVTGGVSTGDLRSSFLSSPRIAVTSGGFGFGFLNEQGVEVTRIVAGQFSDLSTYPAPPSSLLLRRDPAQMWFRTDNGWTCIAGC